MKYIDEFRNSDRANVLISTINNLATEKYRIMEVCGGHTMAIRRFGIPSVLTSNIELISGPGCPVCVSPHIYIDKALALSQAGCIICSYGDLLRVPGSYSSLEAEKVKGADIRLVISSLDAVNIALKNLDKTVVFLAIGFETTTPPTAVAVLNASHLGLTNFRILNSHKTMPEAMSAIIGEGIPINGYIGPGHVSTIAGAKIYQSLIDRHNISVAISGFEPLDILQSILMLVKRINTGQAGLDIQYRRAVSYQGNLKAQQLVASVFEPADSQWRGLGTIPLSGLKLRSEYNSFDADLLIDKVDTKPENKACICGEILKGKLLPTECILFGKNCTPEKPVGACMVSAEGTCNAYYRYRQSN